MHRLLQVTTVPLMLEAFLLPYGEHFRAKGWTVHAAAANVKTSERCTLAFDQCHDISFNRRPWRNNILKICGEIRALVNSQQYQIVHVHSPVAAFLVRLALRKKPPNCPAIIYTAHGFHFHDQASGVAPLAYKLLEKIAAGWTDHLVVINQQDYSSALKLFGSRKDRIRLFPGIGVDLSYYSRRRISKEDVRQFRRALCLRDEDRLLLTIGELNPGKRHQDAIRAVAKLHRPDLHLAIIGKGPMEARLRQMTKEVGLEKNTHFLGYRFDIPRILCSSDGLLFPSEREGLSRSVMEALALEVPVIGSTARGVMDLIADGCGLPFPVGDVDKLSVNIQEILSNPRLVNELTRKGKERVTQFSLSSVIELYEQLYSAAISFRQAPHRAWDRTTGSVSNVVTSNNA